MRKLLPLVVVVGLALLIGLVALDSRQEHRLNVDGGPARPSISEESQAGPRAQAESQARHGFLYGRVTTANGTTFEGRLRWGGDEEAFWGDFFNGYKKENPWAASMPAEQLKELRPVEIFGVRIAQREREIDLGRPFMARFGDIARIEAHGRDLQVTLKSGTLFHLDRLNADDLADGLRVWDETHGRVDLGELGIRSVELLATAPSGPVPERLYGTVRTGQGEFTGFLQWNRQACVGSDPLHGLTEDGETTLRFDTIASIARHSPDSARVTLLDGRELVLSGSDGPGGEHRGIYVDDERYGRVLVSWEALQRVDLSESPDGGSGPAYDDFPPGSPLTGSVTTRAGRRFAGRLVWDLDESETTETLDAPWRGVNYSIPFGLVVSIELPESEDGNDAHARLTLRGGEALRLESSGDLADENTGMLIFVDDRESPEYVPWTEVAQIDFEPPSAMFPPVGGD